MTPAETLGWCAVFVLSLVAVVGLTLYGLYRGAAASCRFLARKIRERAARRVLSSRELRRQRLGTHLSDSMERQVEQRVTETHEPVGLGYSEFAAQKRKRMHAGWALDDAASAAYGPLAEGPCPDCGCGGMVAANSGWACARCGRNWPRLQNCGCLVCRDYGPDYCPENNPAAKRLAEEAEARAKAATEQRTVDELRESLRVQRQAERRNGSGPLNSCNGCRARFSPGRNYHLCDTCDESASRSLRAVEEALKAAGHTLGPVGSGVRVLDEEPMELVRDPHHSTSLVGDATSEADAVPGTWVGPEWINTLSVTDSGTSSVTLTADRARSAHHAGWPLVYTGGHLCAVGPDKVEWRDEHSGAWRLASVGLAAAARGALGRAA